MTQFNDSADLMIKRLHPKADGLTKVTMLNELNKVTLDVIAKVINATPFPIKKKDLSAARSPLGSRPKISRTLNRTFSQTYRKL
jgi:hypothetical protein